MRVLFSARIIGCVLMQVKPLAVNCQTIEDKVLISLPIFANHLDGLHFKRPSAHVYLDRILNVAPEVPMQVHAPGVTPAQKGQIGGIRRERGHLSCVSTP